MAKFKRAYVLNTCLLLVWSLVIIFGMSKMFKYDATAGIRAQPSDWPNAVTAMWPSIHLARANHKTLVMLVHPRCPCSRASVSNLALIMAHAQGHLYGYVIVFEPNEHPGSAWTDSDLVNSARRIAGVQTILDPHGALIEKFHGRTSGQTMVYDSAGRLLFNGGVTSSRAEYGESIGTESIISIAFNATSQVHSTPVYGCALQDLDDSQTPVSGQPHYSSKV